MQMSPAISRDLRTISGADNCEWAIRARAAARAYDPPEPIARTPPMAPWPLWRRARIVVARSRGMKWPQLRPGAAGRRSHRTRFGAEIVAGPVGHLTGSPGARFWLKNRPRVSNNGMTPAVLHNSLG